MLFGRNSISVLKKFRQPKQHMKHERTNSVEFWYEMRVDERSHDDEKSGQISIDLLKTRMIATSYTLHIVYTERCTAQCTVTRIMHQHHDLSLNHTNQLIVYICET